MLFDVFKFCKLVKSVLQKQLLRVSEKSGVFTQTLFVYTKHQMIVDVKTNQCHIQMNVGKRNIIAV